MSFDRGEADPDRRLKSVMRIAMPLGLIAAGLWVAWRFNQFLRRAGVRPAPRQPDHLPHADAGEDLVGAASEDSFPASDPPAYATGSRLGRPARH
jgi:hypothetical protein